MAAVGDLNGLRGILTLPPRPSARRTPPLFLGWVAPGGGRIRRIVTRGPEQGARPEVAHSAGTRRPPRGPSPYRSSKIDPRVIGTVTITGPEATGSSDSAFGAEPVRCAGRRSNSWNCRIFGLESGRSASRSEPRVSKRLAFWPARAKILGLLARIARPGALRGRPAARALGLKST